MSPAEMPIVALHIPESLRSVSRGQLTVRDRGNGLKTQPVVYRWTNGAGWEPRGLPLDERSGVGTPWSTAGLTSVYRWTKAGWVNPAVYCWTNERLPLDERSGVGKLH